MHYLPKNRISFLLLIFCILCAVLMPVSYHLNGTLHIAFAQEGLVTMIAGSAWDGLIDIIGVTFLSICSFILWMGAKLLDISLTYTVFEMGKNANTTSIAPTINALWTLVRDICNLAFIFGFIYIGIRTIIDPSSTDVKRFLSRIIIGALLINFSLFFAKAIIDFSNFTAYQIYTGLVSGDGSLSQTITQQLGIVTLFDTTNAASLTKVFSGEGLAFYSMAGIFMLVAAFTFFAGALLLIVRFVTLIFVMVASPILFAATVFPQTEQFASDIWKKLIHQSFFAPLYLLLTLISIKLVEGLAIAGKGGGGSSGSFVEALNNIGTNSFSVILNFIIIIFFMISALTIASKLGVMGGDMAVSVGNSLRGKVQGAIGRNSVGLISHKLREKYEANEANASSFKGDWKNKSLWTNIRGYTNKAAYGARNFTGADRSIRETLEAGEGAKFGGTISYEDNKKYQKERKKRMASATELSEFKEKIDLGFNKDETLKTNLNDPEKIKFERAIADASVSDLEELKQAQREAIVGLMTESQIEALQKSESLNATEKSNLSTKRQNYMRDLYRGAGLDKIAKAPAGNLVSTGYDFLKVPNHAVRLTSSQMDELKKKLTPTEFESINTARKSGLVAIANGRPIQGEKDNQQVNLSRDFITKQKPDEISKMDANILIALGASVPIEVLDKIVRNGTQSKGDQVRIKEALDALVKNAPVDKNNDELIDYLEWQKSPTGKLFG